MKEFAYTFPILPDRTNAFLEFARECSTTKKEGLTKLHAQIGVLKENWYLQRSNAGDRVVVYTKAEDDTFLRQFLTLEGEFEKWFRKKTKENNGTDVSGHENLPELILEWKAE
ncbi:MAG TPA: hypothetical protein QF753_18200 [Victivallales bacterium]|nr:hypothetical protein [Victivallales bacterium]